MARAAWAERVLVAEAKTFSALAVVGGGPYHGYLPNYKVGAVNALETCVRDLVLAMLTDTTGECAFSFMAPFVRGRITGKGSMWVAKRAVLAHKNGVLLMASLKDDDEHFFATCSWVGEEEIAALGDLTPVKTPHARLDIHNSSGGPACARLLPAFDDWLTTPLRNTTIQVLHEDPIMRELPPPIKRQILREVRDAKFNRLMDACGVPADLAG